TRRRLKHGLLSNSQARTSPSSSSRWSSTTGFLYTREPTRVRESVSRGSLGLSRRKIIYLWPAIHFFSSLLGVSWHPDDQRKVLAVEGPTCWNLPWTSVCNRSSSLP